MPSPVAHGFAGLAVAHFSRTHAAITKRQRLEWILWTAALVFAANAADLDFVAGFLVGDPNRFHHGPTHALIAPVLFTILTAGLALMMGFTKWIRFSLLMGLSYFTHLVLDFFTIGTKEPYGMKLLWPFSLKPVMPPFHLFMDIRRDPTASRFLPSLVQWHNAQAIALELAVTLFMWALYWVISSLQFNLNAPGPKAPTEDFPDSH